MPVLYKYMTMKRLLLMLSSLFALAGCADDVRVVWTEGEADPATGKAVHTLTVVNAPEGTDWKL